MVYAIKHGDSDMDLHKAQGGSSAVVAPAPTQRQPFFGKLVRGARQSSERLKQTYNHLSQPRRSSTQEAHKAMVQRFQLRRVSTGADLSSQQHPNSGSNRRRSSIILDSFNYIKQQMPVINNNRRPFWQRALKKLRSRARDFIIRIQQPIAPDGKLQQLREFTLLLAFALQIVYVPFVSAFIEDRTAYSFAQLHLVFESVFILDLLLAFNTSFYNKEGTLLVVSRPEIVHRYLRSWFVVDLLAAIPLDSIGLLSYQRTSDGLDSGGAFVTMLLIRVPKLVHQLSLAPVVTAARALRVTRQFWTWLQFSRYSHLLRILKLVAVILATAHYMACTWELLKPPALKELQELNGTSPFVVYVNNFYYSMLLLQGQASDADVNSMAQNAYNIGAIMLGSLVIAVVFGNVAMLVSNFYANSTAYQRKMESVFDTMNKMQLPHELRDRIHQYYEHLWLEYECLDGDIVKFNKRLTHSLELEVGLFKYMELVVHIPFWTECSPDFITQIVLNLDVRVYLPDDYVIRKGETGEQLFMINKGKCELVQLIKPKSSSTESTNGTGTGANGGAGASTGKPTTSSSSSYLEAVSDSEEEEENRRTQAENENTEEVERTYYHFRQGESFGELALLMNYRRTASVRAVSYVEMCILNREKFQNVLFKYPQDRKKVLFVIIKQCIKNNLLKDIPYPWKELMVPSTSGGISRTASTQSRRNTESAMMMMKNPQQQRKFSRSNRRVTMFGDNWTVNEVAAALADKIDVEHRDESIVFGFQAADLRPRDVTLQDVGGHLQQRSGGSPSQALLSSRVEDKASLRFASPPVSEEPTLQQNVSMARTEEPAVPAPPMSSSPLAPHAELDEEVAATATEETSRRKRRRRTSSIGASAANELHQQQSAEAVNSLLAQMETMKARLGKAEAVQSRVLSALSALAESISQLDAFTAARSSSPSPRAAHAALVASSSQGWNPSRESAAHRPLGVDADSVTSPSEARSSTLGSSSAQSPPHRRSVAGLEYRRRASRQQHQQLLKRAMTHGIQSIYAISQRPFLPKRRSADEMPDGAEQQQIDGSSSVRSNS